MSDEGDQVLEEYRRLALTDIRTFFDADGNLKPIQDLDDDKARDVRQRLNKRYTTVHRPLQALHMLSVLDCDEVEDARARVGTTA
jgi:hypothetical protein